MRRPLSASLAAVSHVRPASAGDGDHRRSGSPPDPPPTTPARPSRSSYTISSERPPAHRTVRAFRPAQRQRGGDERVGGHVEYGPQLVVHEDMPHRHDAAVADGTGREQQVLARGIDVRTVERRQRPVWLVARKDERAGVLRTGRRTAASRSPCVPCGSWCRPRSRRRNRRPLASSPTPLGTPSRASPRASRACGPSRSTRKRNGWRFDPDGRGSRARTSSPGRPPGSDRVGTCEWPRVVAIPSRSEMSASGTFSPYVGAPDPAECWVETGVLTPVRPRSWQTGGDGERSGLVPRPVAAGPAPMVGRHELGRPHVGSERASAAGAAGRSNPPSGRRRPTRGATWPTSARQASGPSGPSPRLFIAKVLSGLVSILIFDSFIDDVRRAADTGATDQTAMNGWQILNMPVSIVLDAGVHRRRHVDVQGGDGGVEAQLPGAAQHHVGDPRLDRARSSTSGSRTSRCATASRPATLSAGRSSDGGCSTSSARSRGSSSSWSPSWRDSPSPWHWRCPASSSTRLELQAALRVVDAVGADHAEAIGRIVTTP